MQAIEDNNEQMDGVLPKEVYGQLVPEEEPDTVKLAKMNLLLNNVRGSVVEANSFYAAPYNLHPNYTRTEKPRLLWRIPLRTQETASTKYAKN